MGPSAPRRSVVGTAVLTGVGVALWLALAFVLLYVAPHYQAVFADRGRRVPTATANTFTLAEWTARVWWAVALLSPVTLALIAVTSWAVRHRVPGTTAGRVWFGFLLGLPLLAQVWIWLSLLLA
jgi:type II secretory pathway component PulF